MAFDGSRLGMSTPNGGDQDQSAGPEDEENRRDRIFNTLKGNSHNVFYENGQDSYTLGYLYNNRLVLHTIPWRTCAPDPSLVKKQFWANMEAVGGYRRVAVTDLVNNMRVLEHGATRPMTDDEVAAVSYYTARKLQTFDNYWKGGAIVGTLLWYRRRKSLKIPCWWPPKDLSRYNSFPHPRMPIVTGQNAQKLWYAQRLGLYTCLGIFFGGGFGVSSGARAVGEGIRHDPRTQDLFNTYKEKMLERRARGEPLAGQIGQLGPSTRVTAPADATDSEGDAPSFYGQTDSASTSSDNSGDSQTRLRYWERPSQSSEDLRDQNPAPTEKTNDQPYDFSNDTIGQQYSYDDASPTARDESTQSPTESSSGSAWDRLRHASLSQQKGGGSSSPQSSSSTQSSPASSWQDVRGMSSPRGDEETSGSSYSYSSAEEERSLAKEQAQKDFDEMLEKERQGDGPDAGSGGGWRRP